MTRRNQPTIFQRFFRTEAVGGSVLLLFAIVALGLANSPLAGAYESLWQLPLGVGMAGHWFSLTLRHWINDGLMAVFFLLVGLEIKRELLAGELASLRKAALPIACAIGGMIVSGALYWIFNPNGFEARGWGIPIATDIAFALGALALIAPNAPVAARVFLAALAIVDDMGAVLVIALFYSGTLVWGAFVGAAAVWLVLIGLNAAGVRALWPYLLAGTLLWVFVHESGIHATVAGVLLAFTIPTHTRMNTAEFSAKARRLLERFENTETGDFLVLTSKGQQETLFALEEATHDVTTPALRLEHALHNFSAFVVMPLFAAANAGMQITGPAQDGAILLGALCGLVLGKPLGIMGAAVAVVKLGMGRLPGNISWRDLVGYSCLAGIGFTMSLFIGMLAFGESPMLNAAKLGILAGSLLAAIAGAIILNVATRTRDDG